MLVSTLLALGMIAAIVAGVGAIYLSGVNKNKLNDAKRDLLALNETIHSFYEPQGNYGTGNILTVLEANNALPQGVLTSPGNYRSRWGGQLTATGAVTSFTITMTGVPSDHCVKMIQDQSGANRSEEHTSELQ